MPEPEPLIRDIPSIRAVVEQARAMKSFKRAMPVLRPVLRLFGANAAEMDQALLKVDDLVRQVEELAAIPDQFNDLLADRGWIIYDRLNLDVAKRAVAMAEAGDFDGADEVLAAYYDAETIRWGVLSMNGIKAFRARMPLAEKAMEDYNAERYHACVPVVFALLDGMVNELHVRAHGTHRNFSAEGVDLTAWDSLAGHSKGLGRLVKLFQTTRRKTNTEPITIPYRNGIIHGMDLAYDNRIVAAKTWATLFAVRDWAAKVEQGQAEPPPPQSPKTARQQWADLWAGLQQCAELKRKRELLDAWRPRNLIVGTDVPLTGEPEDYRMGTPEHSLAQYLSAWRRKKFGEMAQCLSGKLGPDPKLAPKEMRECFSGKDLVSFEFTGIEDHAAAITEINTTLAYIEDGATVTKEHPFRMVCVDTNDEPCCPDEEGSRWAVISWGVW